MPGYYYSGRKPDKDYYLVLASRPKPKDSFSKYRGVSRNGNPALPYRAAFKYQGRSYYLGAFATELEAAAAYNKGVLRVIGDHAILNELPSESSTSELPSETTARDVP